MNMTATKLFMFILCVAFTQGLWATQDSAFKPLAVSWTDKSLKWEAGPDFLPKGIQVAMVHGNPEAQDSDAFLKIPAKTKVNSHWHNSHERIVLVAGELHMEFEGDKKSILKPGTYMFGPAKQNHKAECVSSTPCVLFITFNDAVDAAPAEANPNKTK